MADHVTEIIDEITNHEGGQKIMCGEINEIAITKEIAETMSGVLPGYNGVVIHNGNRICCIGIGGESDDVKPIQKIATIIINEELARDEEQKLRCKTVVNISKQIKDISERMGILLLNGSIQAARLGNSGNSFKIVASEMRLLSEEVGRIILSIETEQ